MIASPRFILGAILITGCLFFTAEDARSIAMSSYVELEATVISLSIDNASATDNAPNDSAVVRIDKILERGGAFDFNWAKIGIVEGEETSLDFKYTVRPAKIIIIPGETTQSGNAVSYKPTPSAVSFEDNCYVFRMDGKPGAEILLPGLKKGDRFKTKIWHAPKIKVDRYELVAAN